MRLDKNLLWGYVGYGSSFGTNIILLPLILHFLNQNEIGLWYVFLTIGTLVSMIDFGFSPQLARFISYANAGAISLKEEGISLESTGEPNVHLISKLLTASRNLYLCLACFVLLLLLSVGSIYIVSLVNFSSTLVVISAWALFCFATFINILFCYYSSYYKGIGDFVTLNRALLLSRVSQIFFTLVGLYCGGGLIAVSLSFLISAFVFRLFLISKVNNFKKKYSLKNTNRFFEYEIFRVIWHNSWKEGVVLLSRYSILQANTLLCSLYISLSETASYALTIQVFTIISSVSVIYFTIKLPELNAAKINCQIDYSKCLFSKLWISFIGVYWFLVLILFIIGIPLLEYIKPGIMLDNSLIMVVALYIFLESNHSLFASYISTSNKLPYVFPYLISALVGIVLSYSLLNYTNFGVWGILLSHFVVQLSYNNWKWPQYVFTELKSNFVDLLFSGIKCYEKEKGDPDNDL